MSRLPSPGGDVGNWGAILNDFLNQAHNADGTLQTTAVNNAISDGSITPTKLSETYISTSEKGTTDGVATLDGSGKVTASQLPASVAPPDADATTKGLIQLAGDLSGTAAAPTVPGLTTKAATSTTITAGTGLTGGGDLSASRTLSVNFGTTAGTVMQGDDSRIAGAEQTTNKGVANGYASLDGSGKVPAAQLPAAGALPDADATTKGVIQLAGDLGGTAAAPTVPDLANKVATSTTITAGSGLTGGGDLSANRTLSVDFGTAAGTVAQGDDARITGAEQASNKGVANGYAALDSNGIVPTSQLPTTLSPRSATLVVAASNASTASKDGADYVCDGTNDEVEINAALASMPINGGKLVLTEGTFNIASTIYVQNDNTQILGAGTGQRSGATQSGIGTKLLAVSGVSTAIVLVQRAENNRPVYGVLLRDFTVDGAQVGTAVDGILYRSNRGHIDHVHVHSCTGNGIRILGYPSPGGWDTYDTEVAFCQMGDNGAAGILFDADAADDHLVHCILYNNYDNIVIKGASQQITGCHTYNAVRFNIFFDGGGSRTKIVNCKIEGAGQHAVNIDSTNGGYSDIQITGNGFSTNGDSADNTYDHIIIQGPSSNGVARTMIVGNSFGHKNSVTPNKCRYGVNLNSSCAQGTVIVSNSFASSPQFVVGTTQIATAPIRNNGSTTAPAFIRNNANAFDNPAGAVINVKEAPYNARGNGSADDTLAIQAALDAVPTTGGVVYLPPGQYSISSTLTISQDNTTLIGAGAGNRVGATQDGAGSRIEAATGLTGSIIRTHRAADDRTVYGVKIQDIAVDGNSIGTAVDGILFKSVKGQLHNVAINNCTGNGIRVLGYAGWPAERNKFMACDSGYNVGAGIYFDTEAANNTIANCVFMQNQDGLMITQPTITVSASTFLSNTRYGAYLNNAGSRSRFVGCQFQQNGNHGILLDSTTAGFSDISITGCGFNTNGTATTNTYDHIILAGLTSNAISRVVISGCNFLHSSSLSANKPRYAINLFNGASQHTNVSNNSFGPATHWGTAAVNNSGSSTNRPIVLVNTGWITETAGTATIAAGGPTTVTVAHGLSVTPSAKDIVVSPNNSMGSATKFWVNGIDATNFVINVDVSPGASSTAAFAWHTKVL